MVWGEKWLKYIGGMEHRYHIHMSWNKYIRDGGAKSPPYNNNPCRNNNPGGGLCVLLLVYRHADPFSLRRQNNWVDKLRQHVELSDGSIPAESDPVQAKSYKFRLVLYGYISHFFNKPVELGVSMLCSYSQRLMGC